MASIINASSTGSGGIVQTADASGVLQLQSNGTVALSISGAATTFGGNMLLEASGNPTMTVKTTGAGNNPLYRLQADTNYWDMLGVFSDSNDTLRFRYNGTDRMVMNNSGVLALSGGDSDATGVGITFPSTQVASTNANTLDDYEEGTWTAQAGSESGAFTATYNGQAGKYVKIGNRVWATFDLTLSSRTLTGSIAFVYGLPFPVANNGDLSGSFGAPVICGSPGSNFYQLCLYGQNNASYMYITCTTSNTSGISVISNAFWGASTRLAG